MGKVKKERKTYIFLKTTNKLWLFIKYESPKVPNKILAIIASIDLSLIHRYIHTSIYEYISNSVEIISVKVL